MAFNGAESSGEFDPAAEDERLVCDFRRASLARLADAVDGTTRRAAWRAVRAYADTVLVHAGVEYAQQYLDCLRRSRRGEDMGRSLWNLTSAEAKRQGRLGAVHVRRSKEEYA